METSSYIAMLIVFVLFFILLIKVMMSFLLEHLSSKKAQQILKLEECTSTETLE